MIKAIIFDFDGVILDSVNVKTKAFEKLFSQYGDVIKNKVREHHLLNGGISRYDKFKYYYKNFLNTDIDDNKLKSLGEKFSKLVYDDVCKSEFIEGASDLLKYVSDKYKTFICTGTPINEIRSILQYRNLNIFFDDVFGSPKSKEEIINEILKKYNLNKNEVLFLGDTMTDFNAAKKTKIKFIGIKNPETQFPSETILVDNLMKTIDHIT